MTPLVPPCRSDRDGTRSRLGFTLNQAPVTAVQLSRGKGEAQLLFEIALLMQNLARFCADVLLVIYARVRLRRARGTVHRRLVEHAAKRNPDVLELIRGRSAPACRQEALLLCTKLASGYHRHLQLLKAPLFRGIDVALATLAIVPGAVGAIKFRAHHIHLDASIHAAEAANRLVVAERIPFREAYRRVAKDIKG